MKVYTNTSRETFTPEVLTIEPALERPGLIARLASSTLPAS